MNISKALFFLTKLFSTVLVAVKILNSIINNYFGSRELMLIFSFFLFLLVTIIYEKKRRLYSPSFIIYFLICFIVSNYASYNYKYNALIKTKKEHLGDIVTFPSDHYITYFSVFIIVSLFILVYLINIKRLSLNFISFEIKAIKSQGISVLFGGFILMPLWWFSMSFKIIYVSFVTYFFILFILSKRRKLNYVFYIGTFFSLAILFSIIKVRFILLQYILPLILALIIIGTIKDYKIKNKMRLFIYSISCFFLVMIYGIISEMIKLNLQWGGHFTSSDFFTMLSDPDLLMVGVNRQLYRIIDIWTVLGGNIIDLVNNTDFYYGLTYIKPLSDVFDFEYISLPLISAKYIRASYAQPGLLAEGYANFGMIGAVLNILVIFFMSEFLFVYFTRKQNIFALVILVSCFSQVILDGGTVNSVLFMLLFSFLTFLIHIVLSNFHRHKSIVV